MSAVTEFTNAEYS